MNLLRSVGAVFAGIGFIIIVSLGADYVLYRFDVMPGPHQAISDRQALLATVYCFVIGVAGAYLAALLAPDRPMRHALLVGWIGVALAVWGAVTSWNANFGPRWYALAFVLLALPQCWLGGKWYLRRHAATPGRP